MPINTSDETRNELPALGFVGLGYMGSRMAGRLLDAEYPLTVYNRDRAKTAPLERCGARAASTPGETAATADIIFSSLSEDGAVRAVILGKDGLLSGAKPGSVLVETSTVSPHMARLVSQTAQLRNVHALDAPVAGSTPQAESVSLIFLSAVKRLSLNAFGPS